MPELNLNVENWALVESYNTPESAPAHQDIISLIDHISNANINNILCDLESREYVH